MSTEPLPPPLQPELGRRLVVARERLNMTQQQLSDRLGFKDRQTLQAIEAGKRAVTGDELGLVMEITGCDLDFLIDPFRLVNDGKFSFRARGPGEEGLIEFEERAGQWVAFWRYQGRKQGVPGSPIRPRLELNQRSTYEDAQSAAGYLVQEARLGEIPAERLEAVIEEKFGLLVLNVDMPEGISGAACQVAAADTIFINRAETPGRRNFDLAHELFHCLTWDAMPPRRVDRAETSGYKDKHTERLADNFAGALLMPEKVLRRLWDSREAGGVSLTEWIRIFAERQRVSGEAVKWRLLSLGLIEKADFFEIRDAELVQSAPAELPPPFSRSFMERAGAAVERGDVSVLRLIKLLGATGRGGLKLWFAAHGLAVPRGI